MKAQGQADFGHGFEHGAHFVEVTHAGGGIGGGARGVKLDRGDQAALRGGAHIGGVRVFGQVQRHQRLEVCAFGQSGIDAVAVGDGICTGDHRGHQIGHDDRAGKVAAGFGKNGPKHRAIAQVQVPIVGAADRECACHGPRSIPPFARPPAPVSSGLVRELRDFVRFVSRLAQP